MNFILVTTFFPAAMMVYVKYIENCFTWPCVKIWKQIRGGQLAEKKPAMIERFLLNVYLPSMMKKPVAMVVFGIMLVVSIQGIIFAVQLTPPTTAPAWVPDNHMMTRFDEFLVQHFFSPSHEQFQILEFFWGID